MTLTADELDLLADKVADRLVDKLKPKMTMTSEEVAAELNCARQYVDVLRHRGKIQGIKKGKMYIYPRSSIERYVESLGSTKRRI